MESLFCLEFNGSGALQTIIYALDESNVHVHAWVIVIIRYTSTVRSASHSKWSFDYLSHYCCKKIKPHTNTLLLIIICSERNSVPTN